VEFVALKQKITKIVGANFEEGVGKKFLTPPPIFQPIMVFGNSKMYRPLELHELHLLSEFRDPNSKNLARGTIVEIKNFNCSGGCRFRIKIPVPGLKGT